ncbi:MAG TPA: DUF6089 family protein [Bacteroidia bacterium]|nr:DUF6089 family protein [Bacteroidia bacterium]HNU34316.1 DUF6089 family protein [Bacteroidia bacterium]
MRKTYLALLVFVLFINQGFAQSSELGLLLGVSSYKGEINRSLYNPRAYNLAAGIFFKRCMNSHWSLRLGANYGKIDGDDAGSDDAFQQFRNLQFKSTILEAHAMFEFNFFQFQTASENSSRATPFLYGGFGVYRFNPKGLLGDDWVKLQPLGTEGQGTSQFPDRKKYKRTQFCIPFGGGFKFKLSNRFSLTVESGARRIFTDYLDDVSTTYPDKNLLAAANGLDAVAMSDKTVLSNTNYNTERQRGNASDKDWYMFTGVTINWTLSKKYTDKCKPFRSKLR